jgi:hypothetical protein
MTEDWTQEARDQLDEVLASAEERREIVAAESDAAVRRTAAVLGHNVDQMAQRAWQERQRALAEAQLEPSANGDGEG